MTPTAAAPTITLVTRAGTRSFSDRDRLWIIDDAGVRKTVPASAVKAGALVAFLGRVLRVEGQG